ncbi:MAG: nuclease-related domain-containing protein [Woeseiaceae bacterium]|nr:nuclease-related domain-containing protein [Woeseiaceae bacterium]
MNELLSTDMSRTVLLALAAVIVLLVAWFVYRRVWGRRRTLEGVIRTIGYDELRDLVIPKADEGEIHIEHLVLTAQGLLILDVKAVRGTVFGSDKMEDWTVIGEERRYTFPNPQHALYDRIAAVRQVVRQVPVIGRVLFLDGAEFTKGVPSMVVGLDDLEREFGDSDRTGAASRIDAFKPHWEQMQRAAQRSGDLAGSRRRRRAEVIR